MNGKLFIEQLKEQRTKLAVVGLGYVGMPIAVEFAEKGIKTIGYDINGEKIKAYQKGIDATNEVGNERLSGSTVEFTNDEEQIRDASFVIIAVPTPINTDHTPDLTPVVSASRVVGRNITEETIVVFESTVYPGVTENICVPIIEEESGLKCGKDFKVGYSPERINPGDKEHTLSNIPKIVSGMDSETCEVIKAVYEIVVEAGAVPVSSIMTAEAIKVAENSQRDINIAFMNELALVFNKMNIDTNEVVDGMNTKWNALGFRPGLVGGHCIGVDPYYFIYEAERLGYHSQIILNGRIVNDSMGRYIADTAVKKMVAAGQSPKNSKVLIMGLTFKEDCPDIRNSKVLDIIQCLREYGIKPYVCDPVANEDDVRKEYGIELVHMSDIKEVSCIILAVAHKEYKKLTKQNILDMFKTQGESKSVLIDVKGVFPRGLFEESNNTIHWRL